jgi:hypothetical protein
MSAIFPRSGNLGALLPSHSLLTDRDKRGLIMKTLDDYVKELKTDDLIEAAHRAKERNHALLEEQGISMLQMVNDHEIDENPYGKRTHNRTVIRHQPELFLGNE